MFARTGLRSVAGFAWVLCLCALVVLGTSTAATARSAATAAAVAARHGSPRPTIHAAHFRISRSGSGRILTIAALVDHATHCDVVSKRIAGKRPRGVSCRAKGHAVEAKISIPLPGALAREAFTLPVVIEASGAGGTTKLTLVVKAPSVAQELAVEREMLERAKHEKEAREGKEREEKAARQGAERTAREAAERASREAAEHKAREEREAAERREREEHEHGAGQLVIGGSTAMLFLVRELAAAYEKTEPALKITVSGGTSEGAITGVVEGQFNLGMVSRNPRVTDPTGLLFYKIAREGLCMITNSANTIANMTQETVEKIFTGEYISWSQVPGHAITTPIDLYDRDGAAREQNGFETIFLEEALKVAPSATAETTDELEREAVAADPNAIGFVPFSFTSGVNAVPYQGVACTRENGASGSYGGVRNLWLLSKGPVEGPAAAFVNWTRTSAEAASIIEANYLPQ